jgi:hypothetical protein
MFCPIGGGETDDHQTSTKTPYPSHHTPKTPPSDRRHATRGENSPEPGHKDSSQQSKHKDSSQQSKHKEAAKQAAKKNFRDARFGYKDLKSVAEINGRCLSDVEKQDVDQVGFAIII